VILRRLVNDDFPYAILITNESLGTEASGQEVDTSEALPALNLVRVDTPLKRPEDLRPPRFAHGLIFITLDCRAKVEVDREQDILDGDESVTRGTPGIRPDCEQPGKVANAKGKGGQWRV
jgi:hypothetical protein